VQLEWSKKRRTTCRRGYFDDLPFEIRGRASEWLARLLKRHPHCPRWLLPILIGQARRLAGMSREERAAWGRSMLAKRGGYAAQERYRAEERRPTEPATLCRVSMQRARHGARRGFTDLRGI
jgi:hypothetical protein